MTTKPHAQLGDRNSVRAKTKRTPPERARILMGFGTGAIGFGGPPGRREFMAVEIAGREVSRVPLDSYVVDFIAQQLELARVVLPARRERG